jgi:hypothetical protein
MTAVIALCLITPLVVMVVGFNVFAGLLPLGVAVGLVATSQWSGSTRAMAIVVVLLAGVGLTIALFAYLLSQGGFN